MKKITPIFLVLIFFFSYVSAQKVALVLSGGGARGIAHVGVIKALQQQHIPIDAIAGTSMGGLIGGFYAAGYSPDSMESIVESAEFLDWVNGRVSTENKDYFSKGKEDASWLSLSVKIDSNANPIFTSSLADDQSLNFALASRLAQATKISDHNFDSLFVPFRTTGSEIFTQEKVVFDQGILSDALRVTMTVPLFYRPIKVGGKYMFDGGIYNNLPLDVAEQAFQPDIIIAANVSDKVYQEYPYGKDEALIANPIVIGLVNKSDTSGYGQKLILISPNVEPYSSVEFSAAAGMVDSGYAATMRVLPEIRKRIQKRISPQEVELQRKSFVKDTVPIEISSLSLSGFNELQKGYVNRFFKQSQGKPLTEKEIEERYYAIVSEPYFKRVVPRIDYLQDSGFHFSLSAQPKGNLQIRPGGVLASRGSFIHLGFRYTRLTNWLTHYTLNAYNSSFYKSLQAGIRSYLPTNPRIYLEPEFTYNSWNYLEVDDFVFNTSSSTTLRQQDFRLSLDAGISSGKKAKWIINTGWFRTEDEYSNTEIFNINDQLDELEFTGLNFGLTFESNSLNRKQFATQGNSIQIKGAFITGSEAYRPGSTSEQTVPLLEKTHDWIQASVDYEQYLPGNGFILGYSLHGAFSNLPAFSNYTGTLIQSPSFNPLVDSKTWFLPRFRARSFAAGGLKTIVRLGQNLDFRLEAYGFVPISSYRLGDRQLAVLDTNIDQMNIAALSGLVYHSAIGPLALYYSWYNKASFAKQLHFQIGYRVFNRRAR